MVPKSRFEAIGWASFCAAYPLREAWRCRPLEIEPSQVTPKFRFSNGHKQIAFHIPDGPDSVGTLYVSPERAPEPIRKLCETSPAISTRRFFLRMLFGDIRLNPVLHIFALSCLAVPFAVAGVRLSVSRLDAIGAEVLSAQGVTRSEVLTVLAIVGSLAVLIWPVAVNVAYLFFFPKFLRRRSRETETRRLNLLSLYLFSSVILGTAVWLGSKMLFAPPQPETTAALEKAARSTARLLWTL